MFMWNHQVNRSKGRVRLSAADSSKQAPLSKNTGSGTVITTPLPYPRPQSPKMSSDLHELQKRSWVVRGSSCSICSVLATPLCRSCSAASVDYVKLCVVLRLYTAHCTSSSSSRSYISLVFKLDSFRILFCVDLPVFRLNRLKMITFRA